MSNEYKDWLWDTATDEILARDLLHFVHKVQSTQTGFLITGFKTDQIVAYAASQDDEGQWQFEPAVPDAAPDQFEIGYQRGWRKAYDYAYNKFSEYTDYLRGTNEQLRQELIIARGEH